MGVDIHNIIPIIPRKGLVLPGHKFTGPYNPLSKQLDDKNPTMQLMQFLSITIYVTVMHTMIKRRKKSVMIRCSES